MLSRVRASLLLGVCCASGCMLLADLDGLSGQGADGDRDASDAGAETSSDAPTLDGSLLSDATVDAGSRFCSAVAPDFCDDFDDGPLTGKWTQVYEIGGGTATIDNASAVSPSSSLVVQIPVTNMTAAAYVERFFPEPTTDVSLSAFIRIESVGKSEDADLMMARFDPNHIVQAQIGTDLRLDLVERKPGPDGGSIDAITTAVAPLETNRYYRIELWFEVKPGGRAEIRVDGVVVASRLLETIASAVTSPRVQIGEPYQGSNNGGAPWRSRFDDVAVKIR